MSWVRASPGGVLIEVLVVPRASRTKVVGIHEGRLKIQLSAPPVEGEANAALLKLLAERLRIRKAQATLIAGQSGRRKTVQILGVDEAYVRGLFSDLGSA
jgi:uncharacterized protein